MKREKTKIIRLILLFAILILGINSSLKAQISDTKNIKKRFKIDKSTIIDISNKYGDITIDTWNKDSVAVDITCEVSEKNREKLEKKISEINFELKQTGHYMIINTIIGESKNMLMSELVRLKETIGVGESKVEINMHIKIPDNLELRIKNKFGNVYIDDYKGSITIDMANGRLKAHDLSGYVNMKINFGDAIINTIDTGNLEIYYSDLNLGIARKLRMTSKTSNITITEIGQLLVNSSRDDYRIRMIGDFESESSWTDFSINEFTKKSDIKMNYGDLTIEKIKSAFDKINIDARSTKVNLFFDHDASLNYDIISNKDIDLPTEAKIDSTILLDEKEKSMRILGRIGNTQIAAPKLVVKSSSAEIKILKR